MRTLLKTIHLTSIAVFFGSIATYIFLGMLVPEGDNQAMQLNRQWVTEGTGLLTLPALWLAGISGILLSGKPKATWIWLKAGGFTVITLNAYLFVYPAIKLSLESVNGPIEVFDSATMQEAIFGAFNVIMALLLTAIAIKKPFRRRQTTI